MRRHPNPRTETAHEVARPADVRSTGGGAAGGGRGTHGSSPAAWTGVVVILAGVCVAGAALIADLPWLFWAGIGIAILGVVAGKLLSVTGFGLTPGYHQEGDVDLRDRVFGEGGHETDPRIAGDPHEWRGVGDGREGIADRVGQDGWDGRDDGREH